MNDRDREEQVWLKRRAMDRERKRLAEERDRRMHGDRRTQHVLNGLAKRLKKGVGR